MSETSGSLPQETGCTAYSWFTDPTAYGLSHEGSSCAALLFRGICPLRSTGALGSQDPFLSIPIHQLQEAAIAQDLNSAPFIPFRIATEIKNCTLYEGTKVYHL